MKKNGKKTLNQISRKTNVKVKNATPMTCDGIKFRSKLEVYCYKKLLQNNIKADYEIQTFTVLESFKYLNEVIRKITYTPDFIGEEFIIECKGMMNDAFPLRYKLFKYFLFKNGLEYDLYLPRNQKDVDKMIVTILDKRNNAQ
mgnify:CR=1 FL=1